MRPEEMSEQERIDLIDADYDSLRQTQDGRVVFLIGEEEGHRLWDATVTAFVQGNWLATILCAQATCERVLASLVSLTYVLKEPPKGWERWGLGALVKHCRDANLVEPHLLDEVTQLCEARKPLGHWRRPIDEGTLMKGVLDAYRSGVEDEPEVVIIQQLADLAHRATVTATRVHLGNLFGASPGSDAGG